jgi:DNA-binding PadR family transcriptional regulator
MSMKLAILGLLTEGDSHPYELRQNMKERAMHQYMKVQDGSLYYAIEQLKKAGLVDVVEVIREGNRPDKTVYRITEAGRAEFEKLLLEQLMEPARIHNPIYAAVAFSDHVDAKTIARKLEERIAEMETFGKHMKDVYEEHIGTIPRSGLHLMLGLLEHSETELKWLRRLHKDAVADKLSEHSGPLEVEN